MRSERIFHVPYIRVVGECPVTGTWFCFSFAPFVVYDDESAVIYLFRASGE